MNVKTNAPVMHEFHTKHLHLLFAEDFLYVGAAGLVAHAPWAQVRFEAVDSGEALLLIGNNCMAALTAQDHLFLKPIIDSYQRSASDAAKPETPERTRLGKTPPADVA